MLADIEENRVPLEQKTIDTYFAEVNSIIDNWGKQLKNLETSSLSPEYSEYWQMYNKINNLK